ncbi:MAG: hypothetical protein M1821_004501 [Bathelium mastoideum]|nr:MAG: hypothetical protein M1821_004501 [Bathelium mastoideum]
MDPGTALSVVSLGIQCCQGILSYYESFRDQDASIDAMWRSAQALANVFHILERTVRASSDAALVKQIMENIESCQECLQILRKKLDKIRGQTPASDSLKEQLRSLGKRALYPFKESTLIKLREIIQDLRDNLTVALAGLQLNNENTIIESLKTLTVDVHEVQEYIKDENREKVLTWLSPIDVASNHASATKKREENTGSWFLEGDKYNLWKNSTTSRLWINGNPGCGKTILCTSIIDDLLTDAPGKPTSAVVFFYFSFAHAQRQTRDTLLSSILVQLCQGRPLPPSVQDLYDQRQQVRPSVDQLTKTLLSVLTTCGNVFLVIDALDECPGETEGQERQGVLEWLLDLSCLQTCKLHILVLSRKEPDIQFTLSSTLDWPQVTITKDDNLDDIALYIRRQLRINCRLRALDQATKQNVEKTLVEGAEGMFRWVFCQIEELKKLKLMRPRYVQSVLRSLPPTLDETYERILVGLESCHQEALTALTWLAFTKECLTVEELAEACIIEPDRSTPIINEERFPPEEILQVLSSLVVENVTMVFQYGYNFQVPVKEIRLAHFSVKEYLVSDRIKKGQASLFSIEARLSKAFIAECCMAYITYYSQSAQRTASREYLLRFPLLRHACYCWYQYYRESELDDEGGITDIVTQKISSEAWRSSWDTVVDLIGPILPYRSPYEPQSPLYLAAILGLNRVVGQLLQAGATSDIDARGGSYGSALQGALHFNHPQTVRTLLEAGANADLYGVISGTALQNALDKGMVALPLAQSINLNATSEEEPDDSYDLEFRDALDHAKLLLEAGADSNVIGGEWGSPLILAAAKGLDEFVSLLLQHGADPNLAVCAAENLGDEITPIQAASFGIYGENTGQGSERAMIVDMLLESGADANAPPAGKFGTALQMASYEGNVGMVKSLLSLTVHESILLVSRSLVRLFRPLLLEDARRS